MNRREKTIFIIAISIGLLVGCISGMIYQQERILDGIVEFGESITGNNIIIDINETVFAEEIMKLAQQEELL